MRYLVVNAAHAERLFPGPNFTDVRTIVTRELARVGGAVVIDVNGSSPVVAVLIDNAAEIAGALATVEGAVAFILAGLPPPVLPDGGPPSRDQSLAAVEEENARLRKVEQAARVLLASLPRCATCDRPTLEREGPAGEDWPCCDEHQRCPMAVDEDEQAIRALEALLSPVTNA